MRVILIVKEDAGEGRHSLDSLYRLARKAGHDVVPFSRKDDWGAGLAEGADVVLIAVGDGTVGKVAEKLVGTGIPFAVIPVGTANNTATELGWTGEPESVIDRLTAAGRKEFDVGVAAGPWGTRRFFESFGVGPFARTMAFMKRVDGDVIKKPESRSRTLYRDLELVDAFVMESRPETWQIEIDGEKATGPHILVEVMVAGRIGPGLKLSTESDPGDGFFDVVMIGETDRDRLRDYLARRMGGKAEPPDLPVHRGKHVRMVLESTRVHIDSRLWPKASKPLPALGTPYVVDVRLEVGALQALTPPDRS